MRERLSNPGPRPVRERGMPAPVLAHGGRRRTAVRRGFAMPLVIMLALVASIMGAVLLERQAAVFRLADREVKAYRDRHFERGVREVVGEWTNSLAGQPVEKMIAPDGHVLDLELPGGGGAAVYMFDGQGSFLNDPGSLSGPERDDWAGVAAELAAMGARGDGSWYRTVGPLAVSAASAPPEILEAIGNYAGGRRSGKRFASEIERARQDGDLTPASLGTAMNAADFTPQQRDVVNRLLVPQPDLRALIVDVYEARGSGRSELVRRYGGRMVLPGGAVRGMTTMQSLGKFLSWEELPLSESN
jgi:hypothetical protein